MIVVGYMFAKFCLGLTKIKSPKEAQICKMAVFRIKLTFLEENLLDSSLMCKMSAATL